MAVQYEIKDGAILREGQKIALRDADTGTVDYLPGMDKYRAPVAEFLKTQGLDKPPVVPPEVAARMARTRVAGEDPTAVASVTVATETQPPFVPVTPVSVPPSPPEPESELDRLRRENAELQRRLSMRHAAPVVPLAVAAPVASDGTMEGYQKEGAPALDPHFGDKTPAFVDWLYAHHPKEAEERYAYRKTHRS